MKNKLLVLALFLLSFLLGSCQKEKSPSFSDANQAADKPVILIAAFGSSYPSGQKNLNDFDKALINAFPGYDIRWGFTASFIVNKLRGQGVSTVLDRNVKVQTLQEAIDEIKSEGYKDLLVQSFLLMVGSEYRETLEADYSGLNVKFSHPLLYGDNVIPTVAKGFEAHIKDSPQWATIFCAHGNEKNPEYNEELVQLDNYLRENYNNTSLAVMEGHPEFSRVKEEVLASGAEKVQFISFMLTFGDHMTNDVMGDEEDSMKSQLGLEAQVNDGMASLPLIQDIFISSMKEVLNQF